MKRRNAIVPGLVFLLMLAGYVAWCWRPFYLGAPITYNDEVPPAARRAIEQWMEKYPYFSNPSPFTLPNALHRLSKPWQEQRKVRVYLTPADSVIIEEWIWEAGIRGDLSHQLSFKETDGRWQYHERLH